MRTQRMKTLDTPGGTRSALSVLSQQIVLLYVKHAAVALCGSSDRPADHSVSIESRHE
eukprot:IDg18115t1